MINPLGLYAMGLASSPDPDAAGRNAVTMYSNGLRQQQDEQQFSQQLELKREEMRRKLEEDALRNRAIQKYAEENGLDPSIAYMPAGMQGIILQSELGYMTPAQEENIALRKQQLEQQKIANEENAARRKQDDLNKYTEKLSKELNDQGIPELTKSMIEVEDAVGKYKGKDIPGFGEFAGQLPEWAVSDEGRDLRQKVTDLGNQVLKARSGLALTAAEEARLYKALGVTKGADDAFTINVRGDNQLREGLRLVGGELAAKIKNAQAGYSPDVIKEYKSRGSTALDYLNRSAPDPSPALQEKIKKAKEAGYNDEQIKQYLQGKGL